MDENAGKYTQKNIVQDNMSFTLKGGKLIASPKPGEEVVISGISGAFPNSQDVHEFRDNLFNKVNMVLPNRRWDFEHPEMPTCSGTIPEIDKYDLGFFGVHEKQSHSLDTLNRMLQEKTIEAIFDAGLNPADLENTNTGVFVGACFSENDKSWFYDNYEEKSYAMTGSERSMLAHRLSYFLKLKGPSYTTDSACSSSLYALEHAYRAMRLGDIDNAIVGGTNLCLHPFMTMQFLRLGVLSHDGSCKCFDAQGNGYARSEGICAIILQKSRAAKRIYAQVVHVKSNCDGYKEQGITFPSASTQIQLLTDFYNECGVDRYSLSYLEAHGTGTFVGDPEECLAIDSVFTKGRKKPLLIGSVKSNIGHSEPASGLCSITKCLIGMETGYIPPNINFSKPRKEIRGIVEGRMQVVVDKTPFQDNNGLIGVSSIGFGGGNCHVLLKWNTKEKSSNAPIQDDDLPRIICVSGRTQEAVDALLDAASPPDFDIEFFALLNEGFRKNVANHLYRGYAIVTRTEEVRRSLKFWPGDRKSLHVSIGDLPHWCDVGNRLLVLEPFSYFMKRVGKVLSEKGVNIYDILSKKRNQERQDILLLGSFIVQMGITHVLSELSVIPETYSGHPFHVLLSGYQQKVLTLEDVINCAYYTNQVAANNNNMINKKNITETKTSIVDESQQLEDTCDWKQFRESLQSSTLKSNLIQDITNIVSGSKKSASIFKWVNHYVDTISKDITNIDDTSFDSILLHIGEKYNIETKDVTSITLFEEEKQDYVLNVLTCLGRLYELGYNPQVGRLYPPVQFPVSRGTKMISPYIKWLHKRKMFVPQFSLELIRQAQHGVRLYRILTIDHQWSFVTGHLIDGRNLFPASGYLYIVWDTFSLIKGIRFDDMEVVFENCKFHRAATISKKGDIILQVGIQLSTGNFEVVERDTTLCTGSIFVLDKKSGHREALRPFKSTPNTWRSAGPLLSSRDVYKELRLRGYNYKGGFCGIQDCEVDGSQANIKWEDNWVTFLDNMLQLKILQLDSRLLYVPIFISRLIISHKVHSNLVEACRKDVEGIPVLPVSSDHISDTVSSGSVSITGLLATSIPRKKDLGIPVLEKYQFVPNYAELDIEQSARVNIQIILENSLMYQVKSVEVLDEFTLHETEPLSPVIKSVLEDQPLIQPFIKILSKNHLEVDVEVEDKDLSSESNCLLVILSNISKRKDIPKALAAIKEDGFIISREQSDFNPTALKQLNVNILTMHKTPREVVLLLQKQTEMKQSSCIEIPSQEDFSWIPKVQEAIKKKDDVILHGENRTPNGVLGLVNCLRREPESKNVRCVLIMDDCNPIGTSILSSEQLSKNMAINVYKDGKWGTYRHLVLDTKQLVASEHCFVNVTIRGDLTSLRWISGPLHHKMTVPPEKLLVHVYYAALNFRDVMTATGKINVDVITQNRLEQECVQGFEFSGRDNRGRRVMGMLTQGALSTLVLADPYLTFPVPESWSLEDASTVTVVYGTLVYAFVVRGRIKRGESILIHSGTGGIGQAAIRLALHWGCTVYTTVGTQEKREFLKKIFPQLKDHQIGNSRDETFEQMILNETKGKGVDVVLNSLAEEKLIASVRCLARGGRFLEIGKYDMANNNHLSLLLFQKEASYHGVMLDKFFGEVPSVKTEVTTAFTNALKEGAVQPLSRTIFKYDEVEQAFRFMASGKHMGKVLIKIREPEEESVALPTPKIFKGIPRYLCNPMKTYVIVGGLGGFGLELTDWLVLRGARKIVFSSRKGLSTGYQNMKLRLWKQYGTIVKISTADVTTREGCKQLLEESMEIGPVAGIFNLAVVLQDSLFENQSPQSFEVSFGPKAGATHHLDDLTRRMCPELCDFVVFSSVSCGRGNPGQTNYGMANSVMERICEKRRQEGYPALAIEWGAVGEVGLVAEKLQTDVEVAIGGTLQQKISNCLQVLDSLLTQEQASVVSSMVVAEKRGANAANNIVDAVINIIGITDTKSVSLHSTLAELGMDSMTGVEIKQVLEREFEVYLTAKDMRMMTLYKLKQIQEEKYGIAQSAEPSENLFGLEMVFRLLGEENDSSVNKLLQSNVGNDLDAPKVVLFPGVEGFAKVYDVLTKKLKAHPIGLQFKYGSAPQTILEMAEALIPSIEEHLSKTEPFNIVCYSYGSLVALEAVHILESKGYKGLVISLDGAPLLMQHMLQHFNVASEQTFETALICHLLSFYVSPEEVAENQVSIFKCNSWEERLDLGLEIAKNRLSHTAEHLRTISNGIYWRLKALMSYTPSYKTLESRIKVYKPKLSSIQGLEEDYGLSKIFLNGVETKVFDGNHVTFLEMDELAQAINDDLLK